MIGVMTCRAVYNLVVAIAHGEVVRDRDGLVVGDEEAVLRPWRRAPGAYPRIGACLQQIDGRLTTMFVLAAMVRHPFFMSAPAEFGGLHTLGYEAFHRPGVDEHV